MSGLLQLRDSFKTYTYDQDKVRTPEETVAYARQRFAEVDFDILDKTMRAISTPDDYFSLCLLTVWFAFGVMAARNDISQGEGAMLTFFLLTAFFLIYVPFSKIGHYLYYPITRYYLGRSLGYRGVYPIQKSVKPQKVEQ